MHHTPPRAQSGQSQLSDSDRATASDSGTNVTQNKRRRVGHEIINDSISTLRRELMEAFDTKFNAFREELRHNNAEQIKTLEYISSKYDDLKNKCEQMENEKKEDKRYIYELEGKIEALEKNNISTTIEIRNIPRKPLETKADLAEITTKLGKALNLDLHKSEIQDIYRINIKEKNNPPILVKFTTTLRKEEYIRNLKKYSKDKSHQLTTIQLGLGLAATPIYVSEHMTAKTRRLFFLARDFAKSNNYNFCWHSRGRIFIRKKEGAAHQLIKDEAKLEEIKIQETQ